MRKPVPNAATRHDRMVEVWENTLSGEGVDLTTPGLTAALGSQKLHVRAGAAILLGRHGEKSVIPSLRPLLEDRSTTVRVEAAMSLYLLGDRSGTTVLSAALEEDLLTGAPITAAGYLATLGNPGGWKVILRALGSQMAGTRLNAAVALKNFLSYHGREIDGNKLDLVGILNKALADSDPLVRRELVYKLAMLEDKRSPRILTRVARTDSDESVRATAQQLLSALQGNKIMDVQGVKDDD